MNLISYAAYVVGWLRGGHPERFGVAVLIVNDLLAVNFYTTWRTGGFDIGFAVAETALMLIFGGLAFRSDRWWPLAITALLALMVLIHVLTIMTPVPYYASLSARVGLWLVLYVILLIGISERWMAGEAPVSRIGRDRIRETV